MSLRLGLAPAYLSRVFRGHYELKVKHVFGALAVVGEHPAAFFARNYPLGGRLPAPPPDPNPDEPLEEIPGEIGVDELLAAAERRSPAPPPQALVEKTRRLLAAVLDRKGVKRRTVDRALKLGEGDHLGRALRGEADLLAFHVFGTLVVAGVSPARFFAELLAPPGRSYAEVWDLLEQVTKAAALGWRRRQKPPDNGDDRPEE